MNNKETAPMRFKDNVFCMLFREKKNLRTAAPDYDIDEIMTKVSHL